MNIICFPHAGANSTAFFAMKKMLPASFNLQVLEYPGHGKYFKMPLMKRFQSLVDFLVGEVQPFLQPPFVFLGHSMGALVSFEVARKLRELNRPMPDYLLVSGRYAPQKESNAVQLSRLPDDQFSYVLHQLYQGIPETIRTDENLMKVFIPILKADFAVLEDYQYVEKSPLSCKIIAIAGNQDRVVNEDQLNEWSKQTSSDFKKFIIPGDHFSIIADPAAYIQIITQQISSFSHVNL